MKAYLFAHPVDHSLSPAMHTAAFAAVSLAGTYEAREVYPWELGEKLKRLSQNPQALGCNLSLPHKESALLYMDDLSEEARSIGAVNTVICRRGKLYGDNTDAKGFLTHLLEVGYRPQGVALILGAGGAARAAAHALFKENVEVWIWNRTFEKAQQVIHDLAPGGKALPEQSDIPWERVSLLVNASSVGLNQPSKSPLETLFPTLTPGAFVYDMVYRPLQTRLLIDAQKAGYIPVEGLGMLAHQARLAFQSWTGYCVSSRLFLNAAHEALLSSL